MASSDSISGPIEIVKIAPEIALRAPTAADTAFVLDAWKRSQRWVGSHAHMPRRKFFAYFGAYIDSVLRDALVTIACSSDWPDLIYGFAVYGRGRTLLHYVYVKEAYRHLGIATRLLTAIEPELGKKDLPCTSRSGHGWEDLQKKWRLDFVDAYA